MQDGAAPPAMEPKSLLPTPFRGRMQSAQSFQPKRKDSDISILVRNMPVVVTYLDVHVCKDNKTPLNAWLHLSNL